MLNSLMPNERKQQNKSHISLAVPLTDAIQEVSPISTCRHTEKPCCFTVKFPLRCVVCEPRFSISLTVKIRNTDKTSLETSENKIRPYSSFTERRNKQKKISLCETLFNDR